MSAPNGNFASWSDRTVTRSWPLTVGSAAPVTERAAVAHDVTGVVTDIGASTVEADCAAGNGCVAMTSPMCGDVQGSSRARPRTTRPHHLIHLLPGVRKALVGHPPRCAGPPRRLAPAGSLHHRYGLCAGRAVPAVGRDRHAAAPATKRGPDHRRERYPKASLDLRPALTRRATFGAILGRTSTSAPSCRPSADPLETPCGPTTLSLRAPQ